MSNLSKKRLTVKDVHEIYGIKPSTVYWWVKDHKIAYSKIGKNIFLKVIDVERLLDRNEIQPEE